METPGPQFLQHRGRVESQVQARYKEVTWKVKLEGRDGVLRSFRVKGLEHVRAQKAPQQGEAFGHAVTGAMNAP